MEIPLAMTMGTIDKESRIRLAGSRPKERFWVIKEPDGYRLKRVIEPVKEMTRAEVLAALRASRLRFKRDWEQMRLDTREP